MHTQYLPSREKMIAAFIDKDPSYEGVFVTAVKSTGIFCRPTCTAKKPKIENVEFFARPKDALMAGYRACKRCKPMQPLGQIPDWLKSLLENVEEDLSKRWRDQDLRERGLQPERVRRWFQRNHGMTFHSYVRARRISQALDGIHEGRSILESAYDNGFQSLSGFNQAFSKTLGLTPSKSKTATIINIMRILTPLGPMLAAASNQGLYLLEYVDRPMLETQFKRLSQRLDCIFSLGSNEVLEESKAQLAKYFSGQQSRFDLPLITPGTDFQQAVWEALRLIPFGQTRSYQDIAKELANPKAMRAVARANGDNRIAIVIPCHRVIGSNGALTGYGGGLWRKKRLLELESKVLAPHRSVPRAFVHQVDLL